MSVIRKINQTGREVGRDIVMSPLPTVAGYRSPSGEGTELVGLTSPLPVAVWNVLRQLPDMSGVQASGNTTTTVFSEFTPNPRYLNLWIVAFAASDSPNLRLIVRARFGGSSPSDYFELARVEMTNAATRRVVIPVDGFYDDYQLVAERVTGSGTFASFHWRVYGG